MPLSDVAIRNAKPGDKDLRLFDGGGMFLLITPKGAKWWRLKYRFGGKNKLLSLGVYPEVGLKQAREERDKARDLLRQGIDPSAARKRVKQSLKVDQENAFELIAKEWHGKQSARWTPDHAARVLDSLADNVFPDLGAVPVKDITAQDLLTTLRKIEARGAHETATRVLQRCSAVFRYAIVTGRTTYNPAADLKGALTPQKVTHRAALSAADLPEFFEKLDAYQGQRQTVLALRLLVLTFVRTLELRGARWEEFDFEAAEWRIPAERMKMKEPHIVPLSRQALEVLAELRTLNGGYELVFPGVKPSQPISENTVLYALYRMGYHSRATGHGFRATASTVLNELGHPPDVIERQLAHAPRNKVRAAYNRAQYLPERKKLMQAWADYLDGMKAGARILPFRRDRERVI
jgi:integrase